MTRRVASGSLGVVSVVTEANKMTLRPRQVECRDAGRDFWFAKPPSRTAMARELGTPKSSASLVLLLSVKLCSLASLIPITRIVAVGLSLGARNRSRHLFFDRRCCE
jgi:hypothetical protein